VLVRHRHRMARRNSAPERTLNMLPSVRML
jgi:hypothetical protein